MASLDTKDVLLLLDDDANTLHALKRVFAHDAYEIYAFTRPYDALSLLQCTKVGVIISDQCMPQMEGHQFLKRAARSQPDAVRIILSGYYDDHSATKVVHESNAWRYVPKPWEDATLRSTVADAFRHYRTRSQACSEPLLSVLEPATAVD